MKQNHIIIGLLVIAIIAIIFQQDIRSLVKTLGPSPSPESIAQMEVKNAIEKRLIDPGSAIIKFVNVKCFESDSNKICTVCGEINAKNSFGGYVGFKKFTYTQGILALEDDAIFNELVHEVFCE